MKGKMSDMDNPSNDAQDYGNQPPIIPDDETVDTNTKGKGAPISTGHSETSVVSSDHLPIINDIIGKIDEANNILVALSSDPSVDELSTAIALSLSLDKLEKRVTAIYSGETPDALSFLKPEETFEAQPDALQDFVIALNKDKADHLRYKIDGDYVKIFITPYRSRISQEDLEFSYGDFNVDLVIALDVANGIDLDSALRENGRIMHDASIINITTGKPGKFGEIEWSDTEASSVSEMVAELLLTIGKLEKPEATALLTGIIAATDRFANSHTTPHSLEISSQLIGAGANQQLIAKNIASELDGANLITSRASLGGKEKLSIADSIREKAIAKEDKEDDPMSLDIRHHDETDEPYELDKPEESDESDEPDRPNEAEDSKEEPLIPSYKEVLGESEPEVATDNESEEEAEEEALAEDLETTEANLSTAGAEVVPEAEKKPFSLEVNTARKETPEQGPASDQNSEPESNGNNEDDDGIVGPFDSDDEEHEQEEKTPGSDFMSSKTEKTIAPPSSMGSQPSMNSQLSMDSASDVNLQSVNPSNPATSLAPDVASVPEANNIPDMNYMPMPGDEILPPPPTPPVDFSTPVAPSMNSMMSNNMPSNTVMSSAGQSMPSANSNPFLNSAPSQNPFTPNMQANQSSPNMGQSMPSMPNANPFATQPSMPSPNSNPFIAQPTAPTQPSNPGSFQIPGM